MRFNRAERCTWPPGCRAVFDRPRWIGHHPRGRYVLSDIMLAADASAARIAYPELVFAFSAAALVLLLFAVGVLRDPRRFANAVLLGLGLALVALGIAERLARSDDPLSRLVLLAVFLAVALVPFGVAAYLVVNGVTMVRREGLRPANLLSLLAGLAIMAVIRVLAARGSDPVLIVSGGKGGDEQVSEAEAMAGCLAARGFPADRIQREDRSASTRENLACSRAIMDRLRPGASCVIVTSNFHVFRAAMIARRLGVRGQVTGAHTARYYWPSATLREFAAVFLSYKAVNAAVCALLVAAQVAVVLLHQAGAAPGL
jgi:uncharacterized SAM-binding protein YcdF (DUF218 family)